MRGEATVRLGDSMKKCAGTIPSGIVASDAVSDTVATYTNPVTYSWTTGATNFSIQGQKWETNRRLQLNTGYDGVGLYPFNYGGARQVSTPRCYQAPSSHVLNEHGNHTTRFGFFFKGDSFTLSHFNMGGNGTYNSSTGKYDYGGDTQIWLDYGGETWRIADDPKVVTKTSDGASSRNIVFNSTYVGNIMISLGSANFDSIITDAKSIVAPSKAKPFYVSDGDSYFESSQALDADSINGFFSMGILDYIFEYTGFVDARRGQGATGFVANASRYPAMDDSYGSSTATLPIFGTVTIDRSSRLGSASRLGWMTNAAALTIQDNVINYATGQVKRSAFVADGGEDFGQPIGRRPLFYLSNGTWNDASVGGVSDSVMFARAQAVYQAIRAIDPLCTIIHVSPEPFDDTQFGNNVGPPRTGDKSDIHRIAQMRAAASVGGVRYINGFGPDSLTRWWTGYGPNPSGGSNGVPTNSQQAQLVSVLDGIHGTRWMYRYYASKIVEQLAEIRIPASRAYGLQ